MQRHDAAARVAMGSRVWRDLGQLAAEAIAIGVIFSVLLCLAVFVVARDGHSDAVRPPASTPSHLVPTPGNA